MHISHHDRIVAASIAAVLPALPLAALPFALCTASARGDIATVPTTNTTSLGAALHPTGLTIKNVRIRNGADAQFGTYSNFSVAPVTIGDGLVLGTGDISSIGPIPEAQSPDYVPSSPPSRLINAMNSGRTPEFNSYGLTTGAITNFNAAEDVASLEVTITLAVDSNVKFDYIFGSVEFPVWTNSYTDAFLVFLDVRQPENQICFDSQGSAIQVGQSFADLVTTGDLNTAFAYPHGMIQSLTTTTIALPAGDHKLWFEVGDVNDQILDSAVFITNLRAEAGDAGTNPTHPHDNCPGDFDGDGVVGGSDLAQLLAAWGTQSPKDLTHDDVIDGSDLAIMLSSWGACP